MPPLRFSWVQLDDGGEVGLQVGVENVGCSFNHGLAFPNGVVQVKGDALDLVGSSCVSEEQRGDKDGERQVLQKVAEHAGCLLVDPLKSTGFFFHCSVSEIQ